MVKGNAVLAGHRFYPPARALPLPADAGVDSR
jgi:hypothetical protein